MANYALVLETREVSLWTELTVNVNLRAFRPAFMNEGPQVAMGYSAVSTSVIADPK